MFLFFPFLSLPKGSCSHVKSESQDRDLAVLRRAAKSLADAAGISEGRRLGAVERYESKVDTFRRCTMVYPEEMMFCMVKVTEKRRDEERQLEGKMWTASQKRQSSTDCQLSGVTIARDDMPINCAYCADMSCGRLTQGMPKDQMDRF